MSRTQGDITIGRWELRERCGVSLLRAQSHHRTGIDRHWLRPNELLTVRLWRWALCVYWPRRNDQETT